MEPIGPEVERERVRLGPDGGASSLVAVWPTAVGPGIAAHAWPVRLAADGTLHVAAESSAWAFELTHLAPQLLDRLRDLLPGAAPAALRFAVGPLPERVPEPPERTPPAIRPTAEEEAEAATLARGIADGPLRELVAAAAAASLARARVRAPDSR